MRAAADNLKHVHLELGGKNAVIVLADADLDLAADGIIWSAFGTSGQRWHRREPRNRPREGLRRAAVEAGRGRGEASPRPRVGDRHRRRAGDQRASAREDPLVHGHRKDEGATLLTGGEVADGNGLDRGFYYRPTIFGDVEPGMRVAQEEIFGPTTSLIPVKDADEAIRVANGVRFGLSSSIFTRDVNTAFRAMRDLVTGITYVNAGTIGAEVHLPFGGMKETGNGHREAGQAALDVFTEWKSIYVDYSGKLQRAQIDNN
jgi:aldehyde dehydrogenase (NAD+)